MAHLDLSKCDRSTNEFVKAVRRMKIRIEDLLALMDACDVESFVPGIYLRFEFISKHFEFGCFRAHKHHYKDKSGFDLADSWLLGIFRSEFTWIHLLERGHFDADTFKVDWLDHSNVDVKKLIDAIEGCHYMHTLSRHENRRLPYKAYCESLVCHFFRPGLLIDESTLAMTLSVPDQVRWSRSDHWKTDWIFKEQAMTLLLMVKFRQSEFKISRDVLNVVLAHLYQEHLVWLRSKIDSCHWMISALTVALKSRDAEQVATVRREAKQFGVQLDPKGDANVQRWQVRKYIYNRAGLHKPYAWFRNGKTYDSWLQEVFIKAPQIVKLINSFENQPTNPIEAVLMHLSAWNLDHLTMEIANGSYKIDALIDMML